MRSTKLLWRGRMLRIAQSLVWAIFACAITLTSWLYFARWSTLPGMFYAWSAGYSQLAGHVDSENEARIYISPRDVSHPHTAAMPHPAADYLLATRGVAVQYHDERHCIRVAMTDSARYFSLGDMPRHLPIASYYPHSVSPATVIVDHEGRPWATEFKKAKDSPVLFSGMRSHNVELADGIALSGYRLSSEGIEADQSLRTRLFWRVSRTPSADYTLFFHLLYADGDGSLKQLAGFDGPPGSGACPMTEWLPEEMVVHDVEMVLPAVFPPGDLFLALGFYTRSDMQRMSVALSSDDQILIGPLTRTP